VSQVLNRLSLRCSPLNLKPGTDAPTIEIGGAVEKNPGIGGTGGSAFIGVNCKAGSVASGAKIRATSAGLGLSLLCSKPKVN